MGLMHIAARQNYSYFKALLNAAESMTSWHSAPAVQLTGEFAVSAAAAVVVDVVVVVELLHVVSHAAAAVSAAAGHLYTSDAAAVQPTLFVGGWAGESPNRGPSITADFTVWRRRRPSRD